MLESKEYPRVLFITPVKVKSEDAYSLLIRMQFSEWPKDRLAQIYSVADQGGVGEFCGHYYQLQKNDRLFGSLFHRMHGSVHDIVSMNKVDQYKITNKENVLNRKIKTVKKNVFDWLVSTGLQEVIFKVRISKSMEDFISEFKPEMIFCHGSILSYATLPVMIHKKYGTPICVQFVDDWAYGRYRNTPACWLLRKSAKELAIYSCIRLAFGEKMKNEFDKRYGVSFDVTYHLDNPDRFKTGIENSKHRFKLVYTGSLGLRRYEAIQDVLAAVRQLPELKDKVEILVYSPGIPKEMPAELLQSPEVKFHPLPAHDHLPIVLAEATALLMPESFKQGRHLIEYSISTKAHLYMMSRRPVLVYGPSYSGTVDYAIRDGWGLVVSERNKLKLQDAIKEIFTGSERINEMQLRADACIKSNHDIDTGLESFNKYLVRLSKQVIQYV